MRFKDYGTKVVEILNEEKVLGEFYDAVVNGESGGLVISDTAIIDKFQTAINEVKTMLAKNKRLLGVFEKEGETPVAFETVLEREIKPRDLDLHLLKVRGDLAHLAPKKEVITLEIDNIEVGAIIKDILSKLNVLLGSQNFGTVFSQEERQNYKKRFGTFPQYVNRAPETEGEEGVKKNGAPAAPASEPAPPSSPSLSAGPRAPFTAVVSSTGFPDFGDAPPPPDAAENLKNIAANALKAREAAAAEFRANPGPTIEAIKKIEAGLIGKPKPDAKQEDMDETMERLRGEGKIQ